jgi:hypothetical protein
VNSGPVTVTYYAPQGREITLTLSKHLNAVCNGSNSSIAFTAQSFLPTRVQPVAKTFAAAIKKNILANSNSWNTDIENATVCSQVQGR